MMELISENSKRLKGEGEFCILLYFIGLAIYLRTKLIYSVGCVSRQKTTFLRLVVNDA